VVVVLGGAADPRLGNSRGSTAFDLAARQTGRGGSGSDAARIQQKAILDLLARYEVAG
jgi:hypothetical protein